MTITFNTSMSITFNTGISIHTSMGFSMSTRISQYEYHKKPWYDYPETLGMGIKITSMSITFRSVTFGMSIQIENRKHLPLFILTCLRII